MAEQYENPIRVKVAEIVAAMTGWIMSDPPGEPERARMFVATRDTDGLQLEIGDNYRAGGTGPITSLPYRLTVRDVPARERGGYPFRFHKNSEGGQMQRTLQVAPQTDAAEIADYILQRAVPPAQRRRALALAFLNRSQPLVALQAHEAAAELMRTDPVHGWRAEPEPIGTQAGTDRAKLIRADGLALTMSITTPTGYQTKAEVGKIKITADMPSGSWEAGIRNAGDSIRVSAKKSGKAIAGDVRRRLLPDAERAYEGAVSAIAYTRSEDAAQRDAKTRIRECLGETDHTHPFNNLECNVEASDRFAFEIKTCTLKDAERIIEAVEALNLKPLTFDDARAMRKARKARH